jgi:hypothetical protein
MVNILLVWTSGLIEPPLATHVLILSPTLLLFPFSESNLQILPKFENNKYTEM